MFPVCVSSSLFPEHVVLSLFSNNSPSVNKLNLKTVLTGVTVLIQQACLLAAALAAVDYGSIIGPTVSSVKLFSEWFESWLTFKVY